jgi:hypothetical protein
MKWLKATCGVGLLAALAGAPSARAAAPVDKLACQGVPDVEWNGSPLVNPRDIRAVQEIRAATPVSEAETVIPRGGARILLRAQPGMTAEWLQRIASCHQAVVTVSNPATLTSSPLDVRGALISVQSTGDGFAVDITSADIRVSQEILRRAKALVPPPQPAR